MSNQLKWMAPASWFPLTRMDQKRKSQTICKTRSRRRQRKIESKYHRRTKPSLQINLMRKFTTGQALITVIPRHNQQENNLHQAQTLLRDKIIYAWDILEIKTDPESVFINKAPEPQQPPLHHETDTRANHKLTCRLSTFYIYTTNKWNIPLGQETDFSQLSLSLFLGLCCCFFFVRFSWKLVRLFQ